MSSRTYLRCTSSATATSLVPSACFSTFVAFVDSEFQPLRAALLTKISFSLEYCLPRLSPDDERGAIVENLEPETPAGSFSCKIVKRASAFPCFREDRYLSSFRLIDGSAVTGG